MIWAGRTNDFLRPAFHLDECFPAHWFGRIQSKRKFEERRRHGKSASVLQPRAKAL
jgi:hypothetical protein